MPITDDRTAHLNLPKPYADNMLEDDSTRIRTAFDGFDTAIYGKQAVIGYTPENAAMKGAANGYASLGSDSKVPAGQLPSFVDDVLEYATFGGLPGTGEAGKIYVVIATNKTYRWSGSVYTEIASSPGSTDVVSEGAVNLYHTDARALAAVPIASPSVLGKVKVGAGLGIDGAGLLFASAGGGSVMTMVDVVPGSNGVSSITVPAGYVVGAILVAFNGALLSPSDFTATTGTTIGLVGFTAGTVDTFTIISLATVSIGTLPASSVGTTQLAAGAVTPAKTTGLAAIGADVTFGDVTASRSGAPTTGFVLFGNTGGKYLGYSGAEFALVGGALNAALSSGATAVTPVDGDSDTSVATTLFVQTALQQQAVKLTGAQTIAGVKTFSSQPVLPQAPVLGTAVATTSGTAIDFTGIPSWVKRVTLSFTGVSSSGASVHQFQLGTSGGVVTTGYAGSGMNTNGASIGTTTSTSGLVDMGSSSGAGYTYSGRAVFTLVSANTWVGTLISSTGSAVITAFASTSIALPGALDRVRLTTVNGTDTFDAGSVNILYE